MVKGVHERIDEVELQWFGHVEKMGNDRIANLCRVVFVSR